MGNKPQIDGETPTLEEVIRAAMRSLRLEMNTCIPGEVQSYDASRNFVSVQPVFQRKYSDGAAVNMPVINNVPVAFPRANNAALTFPIKKGDMVLLVFSQRSIDKWKSKGGVNVSPGDPRSQDISDAVAIPGVYPSNNPVVVDSSKFVMRYGSAKVSITEDELVEIEALIGKITVSKEGKITIGNGSVDLLDLYDKTLTAIQSLTVGTIGGPSSPPINVADFISQQVQLALIKE